MDVMLNDSILCRLCGNADENGIFIYNQNENETDISSLINKYLPLKISNDGKFPCTICPGCNIQLEATMGFFELIIRGQSKLRDLYKIQHEEIKRIQREAEKINEEGIALSSKPDVLTTLVQAFVIQQETSEDGEPEEILLQLLPDGTLYAPEHEQVLRTEGLEKPRRKRGRPPKPPPPAEPETPAPEEKVNEDTVEPEEEEEDADGRKKRRKRKIPTRFKEAVQGKELERIFREEGVIDGNESPEEEEEQEQIVLKETKPEEVADPKAEVIGHLETPEGCDLGELVIINKNQKVKNRFLKSKKHRYRFSCDICGRVFQHYGRFNNHRSLHKGAKFECTACQAQFESKTLLLAHQKEENHSGEGVVESLPNDKDSKGYKVKCKHCVKSFLTKQSYEVHLKAVHEGHRPYSCHVCDKKFAYIASLKGHVVQHDVKSIKGFPCDICGKCFNHPSSVVYHKQAEHNNGRRFVCNKCNKSFKHKQLLQRHQLVHTNKRPFQCNICSAPFKTKATLLNHQLTHTGVKKYFCEQCGQQFAYKTSLNLHYRWHSGEKPFQCVFCEKSFSQNGNLQEHIRIHTGVKPYCCDFCGTKFTTSSQFKLHVKRHTGERPWSCEICKKTFLNKDTWRCHSRRHMDERPFSCTTCNRGFTEQWALKKHLRIHTGEKPYVCEICDKAFSDCSNLSKHRKTHKNRFENEEIWQNIAGENQVLQTPGDEEAAILYKSGDNEGQIFYMSFDKGATDAPTWQIVKNIDTQLDAANLPIATETDEGIENEIDIPIQNMAISNLQITDEDGNPINFTTEDGHQLTVTTFDGEHLQVTTPDGTVLPVELNIDNTQPGEKEDEIDEELDVVNPEPTSDNEIDDINVVDNQIKDQTIEFTTEDGLKIKLVATDPELNAQYLSTV